MEKKKINYVEENIKDYDRIFKDFKIEKKEKEVEDIFDIIKKYNDGVKILGKGELSKKLTVKVNAFSASAKEKIEAAGGKAEVVQNVESS